MSFEIEHEKWMKSHLMKRHGERKDALKRGRGFGFRREKSNLSNSRHNINIQNIEKNRQHTTNIDIIRHILYIISANS